MKIMVLGLRGFPGVMGGVETHCENLCPRLQALGCEVEVVARSPYISHEKWQGIRFKRLWSPRRKSLETILHTSLGVLYAAIKRPDILHIHAIGPASVTPLARLAGLTVVVTHHGEDYHRQKWGRFARLFLRLGEAFGMWFANERIVISHSLRQLVREKYGKEAFLIPNGVNLSGLPRGATGVSGFGLERNRYVLYVSRLVPEKRHPDLIEAFTRAKLPGWKLAIVGAADHPDDYSRGVLDAAAQNPDIICTGFQTGDALRDLYSNAGLFVLPSSHEGNPIALLEALSYGLPVLVSDISANRELDLPESQYFPLGDIDTLTKRLFEAVAVPETEELRQARRAKVMEQYNWDRVTQLTLAVYEKARKGS